MKKLLRAALLSYIGYQFWRWFEQHQKESGRPDMAVPGLQRSDRVYV